MSTLQPPPPRSPDEALEKFLYWPPYFDGVRRTYADHPLTAACPSCMRPMRCDGVVVTHAAPWCHLYDIPGKVLTNDKNYRADVGRAFDAARLILARGRLNQWGK